MEFFVSVLFTIKSNIALYIVFCGVVTGIIVFIENVILDRLNSGVKTVRTLIITFMVCVVVASTPLVLSHFFPFSPTQELPEELSYDIYNDTEISDRIELINEQLGDEGKQISEGDMKAFIYAMNGDYSLIDRDTLLKITNIITNIDIDAVNILRNDGFLVTDKYTPTTNFSLIFSNKNDSVFIEYWCKRYDLLMKNIYQNGSTGMIVNQLDEFNLDLYSAFINHEPITINDDLKISDYSISEEAKYFLGICVNRNVPFMMANLEGGNRKKTFEVGNIDGQAVYIDSDQLYEELQKYNEEVLNRIYYKISERSKN